MTIKGCFGTRILVEEPNKSDKESYKLKKIIDTTTLFLTNYRNYRQV